MFKIKNIFLRYKSLKKIVDSLTPELEKFCTNKYGISLTRGKNICGHASEQLVKLLQKQGIYSKQIPFGESHWIIEIKCGLKIYIIDPTINQFFILNNSDIPTIFVGDKEKYILLHRNKKSSYPLNFLYKNEIAKKTNKNLPYPDWKVIKKLFFF